MLRRNSPFLTDRPVTNTRSSASIAATGHRRAAKWLPLAPAASRPPSLVSRKIAACCRTHVNDGWAHRVLRHGISNPLLESRNPLLQIRALDLDLGRKRMVVAPALQIRVRRVVVVLIDAPLLDVGEERGHRVEVARA